MAGVMKGLGLSGEQGEYYRAGETEASKALLDASNVSANKFNMANNVNALKLQNQYGLGQQDLASLLNQAGNAYSKPGELSQFTEDLALNPLSGSTLAADQLRTNPLLGQIYGEGGAFEGAVDEEKRLRDQGYKLTNEDREAYGQASGDIARQSGQQESALASALARRGLGSAPSGAAGAMFSGLQGNKFEQLAKMQTDLADRRMQNTMQRINAARGFLNSANDAVNQQFGRNISGVNTRRDFENNYRNFQLHNAQQAEGLAAASQADKTANKGKTLFDALGQGLYGATQQAPMAALQMATGPGGKSSAGSSNSGSFA